MEDEKSIETLSTDGLFIFEVETKLTKEDVEKEYGKMLEERGNEHPVWKKYTQKQKEKARERLVSQIIKLTLKNIIIIVLSNENTFLEFPCNEGETITEGRVKRVLTFSKYFKEGEYTFTRQGSVITLKIYDEQKLKNLVNLIN